MMLFVFCSLLWNIRSVNLEILCFFPLTNVSGRWSTSASATRSASAPSCRAGRKGPSSLPESRAVRCALIDSRQPRTRRVLTKGITKWRRPVLKSPREEQAANLRRPPKEGDFSCLRELPLPVARANSIASA